ncbi:MAG: hypothetical protein WCL08_01035 [Verrucomicrobiota bacterium]
MKCTHCQSDFTGRADAKFCSSRCRVYSRRGIAHKPNLLAGSAPMVEAPPRKPKPVKGKGKRKVQPVAEPTPTLAISTITVPDPPQPRAVVGCRPANIAPPNCPSSAVSSILAKLPSNRPHDPTRPQ